MAVPGLEGHSRSHQPGTLDAPAPGVHGKTLVISRVQIGLETNQTHPACCTRPPLKASVAAFGKLRDCGPEQASGPIARPTAWPAVGAAPAMHGCSFRTVAFDSLLSPHPLLGTDLLMPCFSGGAPAAGCERTDGTGYLAAGGLFFRSWWTHPISAIWPGGGGSGMAAFHWALDPISGSYSSAPLAADRRPLQPAGPGCTLAAAGWALARTLGRARGAPPPGWARARAARRPC